MVVEFLNSLQFLEGLPHLVQYHWQSFLLGLRLLPATEVFGQCIFEVQLSVVESGGGFVGNHDVPLQVVGLHLLQE